VSKQVSLSYEALSNSNDIGIDASGEIILPPTHSLTRKTLSWFALMVGTIIGLLGLIITGQGYVDNDPNSPVWLTGRFQTYGPASLDWYSSSRLARRFTAADTRVFSSLLAPQYWRSFSLIRAQDSWFGNRTEAAFLNCLFSLRPSNWPVSSIFLSSLRFSRSVEESMPCFFS
jgi:hypothetical protein